MVAPAPVVPRTSPLTLAMVWAMAAGTIGGPLVAILASFLIADLGLARSDIGILSALFSLTAGVASPLVGGVVDRIGARRMLFVLFGVASAGLVVVASAPTFVVMAAALAAASLGNALCNPVTNKLIAERVAAGRRGLVTGIKQSGVQVGIFLAGTAVPSVALAWGWRRAVLAVAGVIFAGLVLSPLLVDRSTPEAVSGARRGGKIPVAARWLAVYGFLMGLGTGSLVAYLPLFAEEAVGVSVRVAGLVVGVGGLVALVARIWWARASERHRHFGSALVVMGVLAASGSAMLLVAIGGSVVFLWVGAVLVAISAFSWNGVAMLAVIEAAGMGTAGRASGLVLFGFLVGNGTGPPIFGWSVDAVDSYAPGLRVLLVLFAVAAGVVWLWRRQGSSADDLDGVPIA